MSEMLERVILAMATAESPDDGLRLERMARAAIEAMREPDGLMVDALCRAIMRELDPPAYPSERSATRIIAAMIDAALPPPPNQGEAG